MTEESDCVSMRTSTRVPCFEENIMEDVGDGEWFGASRRVPKFFDGFTFIM